MRVNPQHILNIAQVANASRWTKTVNTILLIDNHQGDERLTESHHPYRASDKPFEHVLLPQLENLQEGPEVHRPHL